MSVVVRTAAEGAATWAMGSLFEHLVSGEESGGALGVSVVTQPPGLAAPLHVHTHEAEAFYLLEGTMSYRAAEETYALSAGSFIYLPAGIPHSFQITGDVPVKFLGLCVPGGLMKLYDEVGIPATEHRLPGTDGQSMEVEIPRWNEVAPRYGLKVL
ncbi:cupin domain-containing protein [Nonomuraea sp. NPDC050556]|uniref:cupin domain-containing protein n=1 Tax=Nonomuraea sp. NPDC050556 TaxID=3364369 RepID=UPI003791ED37